MMLISYVLDGQDELAVSLSVCHPILFELFRFSDKYRCINVFFLNFLFIVEKLFSWLIILNIMSVL